MDNGELDIQEYLFSLCEYMVSFLTSDEISVLKMQHKKLREKRLADRIKSLLCLNQGRIQVINAIFCSVIVDNCKNISFGVK